MTISTYASRAGARRAAKASLGKDGQFTVTKTPTGKWIYKANGTSAKPSGTQIPRKPAKALSGHDKADKLQKFGVRAGTKRAAALKMFLKGATMAQVRKATGTNHYNLLRALKRRGCTVKVEDGKIQVLFS